MAKCNSCGAEIVWAKTLSGKAIPINAHPVDDGNIAIDHEGTAIIMTEGEASCATMLVRYKAHFATCPNAAQHRKPRGQGTLNGVA
jgi:hypothetical protein